MDSTDIQGELKEYIRHLYRARVKIEKDEDERVVASVPTHPTPLGQTSLTTEFGTLTTVIRDLEKMVFPKDFSYWDA